jgi:hypothetical protein
MAIPLSDARALFTKTLIDVYQERIRPTSFLRALFQTVNEPTKEISIEVERMGEKVAVDVLRGTEGNRNQFTRSTEKTFIPPYYREYFDATTLDLYDRVLGAQGNAQAPLFAALLNRVADRLGLLQDKIERAIELQCAQVIETGIVGLKNGDQIDFRRKAGSVVDDGAGQYFADNIDPFAKFEAGCKFLREVGKSGDPIFNAILGSTALANLLANTKFLARQNQFNMALDAVQGPVRNAQTGSTFHGIITAGSYKVQLWAYPQVYEDPNNANAITPYINPKKVTLLPLNPRFKLAYAAVPQLIGEPGQLPVQGSFVMGEFLDPRKATHEFDIQSAPLAIPVAVDQAYTFKAVA